MSARCPEGHLSETEDWCDECGAKIAADQPAGSAAPAGTGSAGSGSAPGPPSPDPPVASGSGAGVACPVCGQPREPGERYCEACGYDYVAGTGPEPVSPVPLRPTGGDGQPAAAGPPARGQESVPTGHAAGGLSRWTAEVAADRAFFDRGADESVSFPTGTAPRLIALTGTRTLIGRRSRARGIFPEIDLSVAPEDLGVSRAHAILDHPGDGSLTVTDMGSANGTWFGDEQKPMVRWAAVPLVDGASIYLGSWTRITFRAQ